MWLAIYVELATYGASGTSRHNDTKVAGSWNPSWEDRSRSAGLSSALERRKMRVLRSLDPGRPPLEIFAAVRILALEEFPIKQRIPNFVENVRATSVLSLDWF